MKIAKFTAVALLALLAMVGCKEHPSFGGDEGTTISNKGLLSLEGISIDCRIDESVPDVWTS